MTDEAPTTTPCVDAADDSDDNESVYSEGDFTVEEILDMRITPDGRRQFLLKWLDFDHSQNTWSAEEDLDCPVLLQIYFDSVIARQQHEQHGQDVQREQERRERDERMALREEQEVRERQEVQELRAEAREGPPTILGITQRNGQLVFVLKWEGERAAQLTLARQANALYPQEVIHFYEQRLRFNDK